MNWKSEFKPIRRATWDEIAEAIHDAVTMDMVVAKYAPSARPRYNRIPCPIHHGKDNNFSYTRHGYKCFVCGASGDVVTFVKEVCELSTRVQAMERINEDFNLHLPINGATQGNFKTHISEIRKAAEEKQAKIDDWDRQYDELISRYAALDNIAMHSDSITAKCEAKEQLAYVSYLLDTLPQRPR